MAYNLIPCDRDQQFLLPPNLHEWLPEDHLARFAVEVVEQLDLKAFYGRHREDGWGRAAYDPKMMVGLLLYSYAIGVRSSREIEKRCREDVAYRFIAANEFPDHATIARFRAGHDELLAGLFIQALRLCAQAGLVRVGLVAIDSKRVKANAALSANKTRKSIEEEVKRILEEAAETDAAEDRAHGQSRGDELPEQLRDPRQRLARLKEAKKRLDGEEAKRRQAYAQKLADRKAKEEKTGKRSRGRKPAPPEDVDKVPVNITDQDSKIMKTHTGFIQGYNGQILVTEDQIVISCDLTNEATDVGHLHPMIDQANANLQAVGMDAKIGVLLADAGYYSEDNVIRQGEIPELLIATKKDWKQKKAATQQRPRGRIPKNITTMQRMDRKLRTMRGAKLYRMRGQTVEPIFGQHDVRGFGRLHRRNLAPSRCEWIFENTAHNLLKLWRSGKMCPTSSTLHTRFSSQPRYRPRLILRRGFRHLRPGLQDSVLSF